MPTLTIDGSKIEAPSGATLLEAARLAGVRIPTLCHLAGVHTAGSCRACLVEIEGVRVLQAACAAPAREGQVVRTATARVRRARRLAIELLLSDHRGQCPTCSRNMDCELRALAASLGLETVRWEGAMRPPLTDASTPALLRDSGKCVLCRRCVTVCDVTQSVAALWPQGRGFETAVAPAFRQELGQVPCVQCGQCAAVCPTGAIVEHGNLGRVWMALANPRLHVVVQTAPAIRAALGECFGLPPGSRVKGRMVAALRRLGFHRVFDTNFAADLTIMEEGTEFLDRLRAAYATGDHPVAPSSSEPLSAPEAPTTESPRAPETTSVAYSGAQAFLDGSRVEDVTGSALAARTIPGTHAHAGSGAHPLVTTPHPVVGEGSMHASAGSPRAPGPLPLFTSCCPAWVRFAEHFLHDFLPHLSSAKSPQQMFGAVAKTWYARSQRLSPDEIFVVSAMPCTAKKMEAQRNEMRASGVLDVDAVLTTREIGRMIREAGLDFAALPDEDMDAPLGLSTGAADIFANTGGVMEAALRTVHALVTGRPLPGLRLEGAMDLAGVKEGSLPIEGALPEWSFLEGRTLRIAIVHGLANARRLAEEIRAGRRAYDFVEVMACPGGCIGGGGQPRLTDDAKRLARIEAIRSEDEGRPQRQSHENPAVKALYGEWLGAPCSPAAHALLHTEYTARNGV